MESSAAEYFERFSELVSKVKCWNVYYAKGAVVHFNHTIHKQQYSNESALERSWCLVCGLYAEHLHFYGFKIWFCSIRKIFAEQLLDKSVLIQF